jgi:hypothetical protein
MYHLYVTADAAMLIEDINTVLNLLYRSTYDEFSIPVKLRGVLRDTGVNLSDIAAVGNALALIKEQVTSLDTVMLKLSFDPTYAFVTHMYDIILPQYQPKDFLFDIKYDPSLVLGLEISAKGKYLSKSFAADLITYFSKFGTIDALLN